MRLKRLELQGFKSFVDRTILTFNDSITGVVGPNGCGKSNIVDAILWVMGEQSPKHLRGNSMTDVIFNGSESRPAMSMAEVTLVLDRTGVALPPQYSAFSKSDEISITRRLFRDGLSEYCINKSACRLKDVHELFMDTGVGRRAYSIIEQGQIDRMINVKPEERRLLFEEVAGITKYKAKRKEAEKKLEATRQNLARLQDLIGELEKRIRSLKVQATRAKKYRELKSELEVVDLFLLGRTLFRQRKEIEKIQSEKEAVETKRAGFDAEIAEADATITRSEVSRVDLERSLETLTSRERDVSVLIQRLESDLSILEERRKNLILSKEQGEREEREIVNRLAGLSEERETYLREQAELGGVLSGIDGSISELEQGLLGTQQEKSQAEQTRDSAFFGRNELTERVARLKQQIEHGEQREREYVAHGDNLNRSLADLVALLDGCKSQLAEVEKRIDDCSSRSQQAEKDVSDLDAEIEQTSKRLSEFEDKLFRLREEFHLKRSRLESLKELQENLEGYSPTAREILLKLGDESPSARPLAEVLQPEAQVEEHLEMLLGSDMNTLIVATGEEAKRVARLVQQRGLEQVRIVALSELPLLIDDDPVPSPSVYSLLSKVKVESGYDRVARFWLSNVCICSDIDELFDLRDHYPEKTFLTNDTRVISHSDRSITSGNLPAKSGVFARRREIEDLKAQSQAMEQALNFETAERERLFILLQERETRHADLKDKLTSFHVESVELRKEKEKVQLEMSRADRDHKAAVEQSDQNRTQLDQIRRSLQEWNAEVQRFSGDDTRFQTAISESEARIRQFSEELATRNSRVSEKRAERSALIERSHGLEFKLKKLSGDLGLADSRQRTIQEDRARGEREMESIAGAVDGVIAQKKTEEERRSRTLIEIADTREAYQRICTELGELRESSSQLSRDREEVLGEIQALEIQLTEKRSGLDHLRATSIERYSRDVAELDDHARVEIEKLPLFRESLNVTFELLLPAEQQTLLEQYLQDIRSKVSRYGEVNLTSIEEFDEVEGRYNFLVEQRTDLEKSITTLEEAIRRIDETTKIRFEETFRAVELKFKEIFPILFNGGKGELKLTEGLTPLEAGVDVMAQPPGKRLQSISLLSGGEKALTAVSLVLAIFARKPSPFCLLDEVDAPLDDANVSRFNTVIKKMSEKTQFIVITHNKKTMEITHALYGVTMERPGVSKMASVTIH